MFGLSIARVIGASILLSSATAALAVGLGPLEKSGVTASERKGLYLKLLNPYEEAHRFRVYVEEDSGIDEERVKISPSIVPLGPKAERRILVIVEQLVPGEDVQFRLCAEKIEERRVTVHARICSKLGARRVRATR